MEFHNKDKWISVQSFSFHLEGEFLKDMQKATFLRFLARMIVESLPTGWLDF